MAVLVSQYELAAIMACDKAKHHCEAEGRMELNCNYCIPVIIAKGLKQHGT